MISGTNRLYSDLAWLWPLGGSPDEYAQWCEDVTRLVLRHARRDTQSLLNMGCDGGKNAFNLKKHFRVTGIDLSPHMLELARELNPDCRFLEGDMRTCRLDERFDAVLIDDAVSYMTSRADLLATFQAAYEHLHPGGVMVVAPRGLGGERRVRPNHGPGRATQQAQHVAAC